VSRAACTLLKVTPGPSPTPHSTATPRWHRVFVPVLTTCWATAQSSAGGHRGECCRGVRPQAVCERPPFKTAEWARKGGRRRQEAQSNLRRKGRQGCQEEAGGVDSEWRRQSCGCQAQARATQRRPDVQRRGRRGHRRRTGWSRHVQGQRLYLRRCERDLRPRPCKTTSGETRLCFDIEKANRGD